MAQVMEERLGISGPLVVADVSVESVALLEALEPLKRQCGLCLMRLSHLASVSREPARKSLAVCRLSRTYGNCGRQGRALSRARAYARRRKRRSLFDPCDR